MKRGLVQNGTTGIIAAVTLIIHALLFGGGMEIEYADTVDFTELGLTHVASLGPAGEDAVKAVRFTAPGQTLVHGENIRLQGELNFTGIAGDLLAFKNEDGHWIEIARYLSDSEV